MDKGWNVSYKQLGIIIFAFSLGIIAALLLSNSNASSTTSFTTTELIGFVLSVILSGASIVLAISAIALGKSSEQSVIKRSDESIRLQNEVFIRTTEALQRIEASTGVTEKRIEDIITGRVGDVSQKIAGLASEGQLGIRQSRKELEAEIRETLMSAISGSKKASTAEYYREKSNAKRAAFNEYEKVHVELMGIIKSITNITVGKIGHGIPSKEDDDQIDSIFFLDSKRIGVSTFRKDTDNEIIEEFLRGAAKQIESNNFSKIIVFAFDIESFEENVSKILKPYKNSLKEKILFKQFDSNYIDEEIVQDLVSNKSIQPTTSVSDN
jgi:hypothetical protein